MTENIAKQTGLAEIPSHWMTLNGEHINRIEDFPRRLVVRKFDHKSGFYSPYHSHGWGQLLFISEGLIQVSAQGIGYWAQSGTLCTYQQAPSSKL